MNSRSYGRGQFRWVLVPVLVVAAVVATGIAVSAYFGAGQPRPYPWWPWAPFGLFFFIPAFFIFFFVLRSFWWGQWGGRGWYYHEDSATQVLRERFARGELTKEQFEQMRKDLQS